MFHLFSSKLYKEAWHRIRTGAIILDVRTPEEFHAGHIENALNIPHDQLMNRTNELGTDKNRCIVIYCASGTRADTARRILVSLGRTNTFNARSYSRLLKTEHLQ